MAVESLGRPADGPGELGRRNIVSDLRTLYREASHYLGGQVGALALGFVSFPIFTRVLSVADYGMMSLAFQISAMAAVLCKMGLQNSIQRFYQEQTASSEPGALRKFCSTLLFGAALCALAVAVLFLIGLELVSDSWLSPGLRKVLLIGSGLIFVRGLQPIVMNFLRAQRRTKAFNGFDALAKAASLAFVCLLLFTWSRGVRTVLIGTVAVELVSVVLLILLVLPKDTISLGAFDGKLFRTALVFGIPLAAGELAFVILDSGDRILVQHYLGSEALGYYSCAYNITNYIAMFLMYPVNLAVVPIYMNMWTTRGPRETAAFLSKALDNFIMAVMCVLAGVAVTAPSAVIVLGSKKLMQAAPLLPILVLGLMLYTLHIFFIAGPIIHKKTIALLKIVASCAVLNIALNIWLIPRIGLQGAAVATLISYAVFLALIVRASLSTMPLRLDPLASLRYLLAAVISATLASRVEFSSHFLNFLVRGSLCVLLYIAALWAIDRRVRSVMNGALRWPGNFFKKRPEDSGLAAPETVATRE
jgi:O-antigen/teichoic acid export membrane protein